jgi:hypothetical protein
MKESMKFSLILAALVIAGCGDGRLTGPEIWEEKKIENVVRVMFRSHVEYIVFKRDENKKLTPVRLTHTQMMGTIPVYEDVSKNEPMWVRWRVSNYRNTAFELHIHDAGQLEGGSFQVPAGKNVKNTVTNTVVE